MSDRVKLPARRLQVTEAVAWEGQLWLASVGFDAHGVAREIFLKDAHGNLLGSALARLADDVCIAVSRLLQHGDRVADLAASLTAPRHDTGSAPPTLLLLALAAAVRIEAESGSAIREAMLCAAGRHPLQREGAQP